MLQCKSPVMARTYRQSHVRDTSGMAPTPDLLAAMFEFRLIPSGIASGPDVVDTLRVRGVLTLPGHSRISQLV